MSCCLTELLLQHPSNGWQRTSATGITPSHGSHATAPIACDGFTTENRYHARAVAGREYHCPHYRSSPHRELPSGYSWLVSLPGGENEPKSKKMVSLRCSSPPDRGAAAMVAYAHHKGTGKVFDGLIFDCQGSNLLQKQKQVEIFGISTRFLTKRAKCKA